MAKYSVDSAITFDDSDITAGFTIEFEAETLPKALDMAHELFADVFKEGFVPTVISIQELIGEDDE